MECLILLRPTQTDEHSCYRIAGLSDNRQTWAVAQIATKRRNLLKLFAHCLDTQIHLWDQRDPRDPHRNPIKKASLSENVMKEDERVFFQPFHP